MVDMMGLPHDVWVVREMLNVEPLFRCDRYAWMPVVRERRYFVDGPTVLYSIPYWPEDALEQGGPDTEDWRDHMGLLNAPVEGDALASKCGQAVGGKWSVDILEAVDGLYIIDMATAERSYGWNPDLLA